MNRLLTILFITLSFTAASAFAGSPSDDRISNLERQLADIQRTYLSNNQETASAVSRVNTFQDELSGIKGKTESVSHQIKSQHEEFLRRTNELENRIQAIEDKLSLFSTQMMNALERVSPEVAEETALYQKGLDLVESSKYLEAAAAFQSFADRYPKSQFAAGAKFWIAECFYSLRDYKRAIKEYQNFIEKYPRDPKISDAVFKQGNSFYELGLLEESRSFYEKVVSSYPQSQAAKNARAKLARIVERQTGAANTKTETGNTSSYPTLTIEQQRQKMGAQQQPAQQPGQKEKPKTTKEF